MRAFLLSKVNVTHLCFEDSGVAPLSSRCRNFLDEADKAFALLPGAKHLLDCDGKCILSVLLSTNEHHYS